MTENPIAPLSQQTFVEKQFKGRLGFIGAVYRKHLDRLGGKRDVFKLLEIKMNTVFQTNVRPGFQGKQCRAVVAKQVSSIDRARPTEQQLISLIGCSTIDTYVHRARSDFVFDVLEPEFVTDTEGPLAAQVLGRHLKHNREYGRISRIRRHDLAYRAADRFVIPQHLKNHFRRNEAAFYQYVVVNEVAVPGIDLEMQWLALLFTGQCGNAIFILEYGQNPKQTQPA
ncbi:hypothetical protein B8W70_24235 [Pseudomonas sp. 1239]|nr:hypothetical protein B8W70_24235 [Pseudomonas sp. 1239]